VNATRKTIDWTEQGLVPDSVIRHGIRRMLKARLQSLPADIEAQARAKADFIADMRQQAIAPLPHKANEQHYELPAGFFTEVLGRHLKYSCCYWPEGVNDLDSDAPQEIRDVQGGNQLYGVRLGLGETTLDNRYLPSGGHIINSFYEQVTGDHAFGVLEGTYVRYFTLYEDVLERKTVLAAKVLGATILGSAPPFEKFYAGGTGHYGLRGFEYRGVSTRGLQTNVPEPRLKDPIGSDWIFLANAEITVPLVGENFAGLFFVDSGTIDTGDYRLSIGTGIQIMVPQIFGNIPMRFEIATPLLKDDLDETQVFSFSGAGMF